MNCPLCDESLVDHDAYVAHLADTHGLIDDPGTTSGPVVEESVPPIEEPAPPPSYTPPQPPPPPPPPPATRDQHANAWIVGAVAVVVIFVAGALLLRSSGSSDTPSVAASSPSGAVVSVTPTTQRVDSAQLAKVNVQASDLPADWIVSQPRGTSADDEATAAALMACLGIEMPATRFDIKSFLYKSPDANSEVSSELMYGDAAQLENYETALGGPNGSECIKSALTEGLERQAPEGGVVESVTVPAPRPVDGGDQGTAYTVTMNLAVNGRRVSVSGDVYSVRVGPLVVETTVLGPTASRSTAIADTVVPAVVDRARTFVG